MDNKENNLIDFCKKSSFVLSDDDIKSLFMGLIKLVKEKSDNEALKKYEKELIEKQNIIDNLKTENLVLLNKINKNLK